MVLQVSYWSPRTRAQRQECEKCTEEVFRWLPANHEDGNQDEYRKDVYFVSTA
jgi:hypothetical protein